MGIKEAKQAVSDAVYALKLAQVGAGRGAGGREVALAVTNAEQAELWLYAAERAQQRDSAAESVTSEGGLSGGLRTNVAPGPEQA